MSVDGKARVKMRCTGPVSEVPRIDEKIIPWVTTIKINMSNAAKKFSI